MDFLTTTRLLMDLREKHPNLRYSFEDGQVVIRLDIEDNVPAMFFNATKMFEPA